MAYSGATAIESAGSVSAEAILAWFAARGPSYAPNFAPDGQYQPPPPDLGQAIVDECQRYADHVINWDMTAAQILHETAAWQSKYARERNNPGGIGAINSNPDLAITFPTVQAGVRAHVAHLLVYAVGDGPWTHSDPRRDAVARAGWLGVADAWQDLNGKWAWPGTTYAQQIAAQANILVAYAATLPDQEGTPMPPPSALVIRESLIPAGNSNRPGTLIQPAIEYITVHETGNPTAGANAEMHRRFAHGTGGYGGGGHPAQGSNPAYEGVSFHWTVDDREAIRLLPSDEIGYHAGDGCQDPATDKGCFASEAIETCVNRDGNWERTKANLAALAAERLRAHALPIERMVQHNRWSGKDCPQRLRAQNGAQWNLLVADVSARLGAPSPPPATDGADPVTGHWIAAEFVEFYDANGGVAILGRPISGAFMDTGLLVQYFERYRLEHHPENPPPYDVLGSLLGTQALARDFPDGTPS